MTDNNHTLPSGPKGARGGASDGKPDPADKYVGVRVRLRRTLLGMSQEKLGEAIGLTFQQVQKYERGANRIGSGRLWYLSRALDVPVSFFYDGLEESLQMANTNYGMSFSDSQVDFEAQQLEKRETLELVRNFGLIKSPKIRKRILELIKAIAKDNENDNAHDSNHHDNNDLAS